MHPPHPIALDQTKRVKKFLQLCYHGFLPLRVAVVGLSNKHVGSEHARAGYEVGYGEGDSFLRRGGK